MRPTHPDGDKYRDSRRNSDTARTELARRLSLAEANHLAHLKKAGFADEHGALDSFRMADGSFSVPTDQPSQQLFGTVLTLLELRRLQSALWGPRSNHAESAGKLLLMALDLSERPSRGGKAKAAKMAAKISIENAKLQAIADKLGDRSQSRSWAAKQVVIKLQLKKQRGRIPSPKTVYRKISYP